MRQIAGMWRSFSTYGEDGSSACGVSGVEGTDTDGGGSDKKALGRRSAEGSRRSLKF